MAWAPFRSGYPLKLYLQIPCVFPVRLQIFPVPIYIICECYIHRTDLADLSSFWKKIDFFLRQLSQYPLLLESEHLQLELIKFPVFSLCLDKIPCVLTNFPNSLFTLTGIFFGPFSLFSLCRGYPVRLYNPISVRRDPLKNYLKNVLKILQSL